MSDYSDLFEDPKPNPSLAVRLNADANPVQEAEYLKLAKRYSVPIPVIRSAPDDYKARAKAEDVDLFTEKAPVLRSWLSDSDKARLAATDAKSLAEVERTFDRTLLGTARDIGATALKGAVGLPQAAVGLADLSIALSPASIAIRAMRGEPLLGGGYIGKGLEAVGVDFNRAQKILSGEEGETLLSYSPAQQAANQRVSEADGFTDTLTALVQNPSTIATMVGESLPQMLGGAAIGRKLLSLGANALGPAMVGPNLPGLMARQFGEKTATLLASAFGEGGIAAGGTAEQLRSENADGLIGAKETLAALGTGAGTTLFGFVGGRINARLGLEDIDTALVSRGLNTQAAETIKRGFISSVVKSGVSEGFFEELPQSIQEQMWQNWANDRPLGQGVGKAAAQGVVAGFAMGGGFQAISRVRDRYNEINTAQTGSQQLLDAINAAAPSALRNQSPEEFRSLVQAMADNTEGAPSEIYIDAEVLNQLAPEVMAQLPQSVRDQIPDALAANDVVSISTGDVLTIAPGTPLEQVLVENARVGDPRAMTQVEASQAAEKAQEFVLQQGQRVIQQAADQQAVQQSHDMVKQTLLDQLNTVGRDRPAVNENTATLYASLYTTLAGELGITPEAAFGLYGVNIVGQTGQGGVLNAKVPNEENLYADDEGNPVKFYHGGPTAFTGIRSGGRFGGAIFVREGQPSGYGANEQEMYIRGPILSLDQLRDELNEEAGREKLSAAVGEELDEDRADLLIEALTDGSNYPTDSDVWEIIGALDEADAQTEIQKLRGKVSRSLGYGAVRTPDEFDGETVMVLDNAAAVLPNDPNILNQRAKTQAAGRAVPESIDAIANVESAFEFAGTQSFPTNRDFKLSIQARIIAAAKAAKVDLSDFSKETEDYLVRVALADGQTALRTNANAVGWYNEKVTKALRLVSLIHPEINTDPKAKFAFVWALAVTSNGMKVDKNFALAEKAYEQYKASGQMPTNIGEGTAAGPINKTLGLYNILIEKNGFEAVEKFMTTMQTVKQVEEFTGQKVSGENKTTMVYGAAALGPKIGNGFFMNLYGRFEQLTMDRWLMRTWGRWTGTLVESNPGQVKAKRTQLKALIQSLSAADKKAFETIIKRKLTVGDTDAVALAIWKASQKPENRVAMARIGMADDAMRAKFVEILGELKKGQSRASVGDELRKGGNALTKYIDGQKEAPTTPERGNIRKVFARVLSELQKEHPALTMSDYQALLWYPEKRLYDAAKTSEEATDGYNDDEAPDYANAAAKLARGKGIADADIAAAVAAIDAELQAAVSAGGARPGERGPADSAGSAGQEGLLNQEARGTFNPATFELALNENSNMSTVHHEMAHAYLEIITKIASEPNAPQGIVDQVDRFLKWQGIPDLASWNAMTLDQKRPHHEAMAENYEHYLITGKAPSVELQPLFRKFKLYMLNAYKSLKSFFEQNPDVDKQLPPEMVQFYDRMLASEEQIAQANEVAGLLPDQDADAEAVEKLTARSLRDLKWTVNARNKEIKRLQAEAKVLRREVRIEARRDVMSQPVYRLWSFLSAKMTEEDKQKTFSERAKSNPQILDPSVDSLLVAVAKLGGIQRESAAQHLGVHSDDFNHPSGVFSKPVFRVNGGRSADAMGELLAENGYLLPNETGRYDLAELEELIDAEIRGDYQYSIAKQYAQESERGGEGLDVHELSAGRLDLANLKSLGLPEEMVQKLEAMKMVSKDGGIHPDILADAYGFMDGYEMIAVLMEAEAPLSAVEGRTDQRMLEEHGDLVDQRSIEAAANEAVHNEARAKSLATELKSQADAINARTDTGQTNAAGSKITVNALLEAAKQFAANVVSRTPIKDLQSKARQHTAAERRAGKRWQEHTTKGETADAIKAKQDQVLNNAAAKAALEAQAEMRKILDFFKRVYKDGNEKTVEKGRDPDVVNAARAILGAYGIAPKGSKTALEYLALVEKNDPGMYAALQPSVQGALNLAQPLEALTMDELRALHEEIQGMWHLAKRSRQMEVDGNMLDLDDAEAELQDRMQVLGVPTDMPGESGALTPREELARKLQFVGSILRRVEQWAEGMGKPFTRLVFQPVKDAADRYRADRVKYRKAYQALIDTVAPFLVKGQIVATELGYTFGKGHNGIGHAELLHAILHTGNESNKRKLLLGRKWATENADGTLDTSRWDAFIKRAQDTGILTKAHYDFAQGVWNLLEQTKPLAQKTHRDVFGRYFAEVTADSFTTPFGTYAGGYVPAQADPRIVQDAALRDLATTENENMAFSFPGTNKGFTKGRVEYNRPLMLDLRTIGQHIDKVLLFSHMEPAVRDVNKLLSRKGVSYSLGRIDPTIYAGMLTPWLNRSARQIVETPIVGDGGISRVLSAARSRAGMALMFANVSNTIQQLTGFSLATLKVKPASMMRATAQFIASPKQTARAVSDASAFMANRMENEIFAINDAMDQILLDPSLYQKAQAWTQKHAYFLQTAMANTMEPIIWTAAYNDALADGQSEKDAVRQADGVIRTTQGSTLPEDVSRIETGPAYARVFTQFIGYFNMMANTNATALKQIAQEEGLKKGAGKALGVVTLGFLVPIWVAEAVAQAMRGGPEDEDDDGYLDDWLAAVFGFGTIKGSLAMVPFVGQLANAGIARFNGNPADDKMSLSPAVSLLESAVGVPIDVYKAITDPEKLNKRNAVRDVASAVSIATGLPAVAIARPLGYLAGVEQGRIEPTSAADMARGFLTGTASPESKQ